MENELVKNLTGGVLSEFERSYEITPAKKIAKSANDINIEKKKSIESPILGVDEIKFNDLDAEEIVTKVTKLWTEKVKPEARMAVEKVELTGYNLTMPISAKGESGEETSEEPSEETVIARLETKQSDVGCCVVFYIKNGNTCSLDKEAPILEYHQDPAFMGLIDGKRLFAAVKIEANDEGKIISCLTRIYELKDDKSVDLIAEGAEDVKGIRLIQIDENRIGVFMRPKGGEFGEGQITYTEIKHLDELQNVIANPDTKAIVPDLFIPTEWGGVNDVHRLAVGRIGVIGHIAEYVTIDGKKKKNYSAVAAVFDPTTRQMSDWEVIATQDDLPQPIENKTEELNSVIYPGGSVRNTNGTMTLYCGVGDIRAFVFKLKDPFLKFENPDYQI